ncbi:MAG: hypothetical protein LBR06_09705 [Bacteroidales bacterium]|nr:hypothetical protein [Bacteroidales bacterium]
MLDCSRTGKFFSAGEMRQLTALTDYFEGGIQKKYPANSLTDSYSLFFKEIENPKLGIAFYYKKTFDSAKVKELCSDGLYAKIWNTDVHYMQLRPSGPFIDFMRQNPMFTSFCNALKKDSETSPGINVNNLPYLLLIQRKVDMSRLSNRIIIAVLYLSLERL